MKHAHAALYDKVPNGFNITLTSHVLRSNIEEAGREHTELVRQERSILAKGKNITIAMIETTIVTKIYVRQIMVNEGEEEYDEIFQRGGGGGGVSISEGVGERQP